MTVIGKVGCGKTSLLYSIMQEMEVMSGSTTIKGSISYVEQEPFIFSASIEDNILFGNEYDKERLNDAIKNASLTRDIELFSNGVKTVIGERGTNISGGQKARISLARAIYDKSDIVLLDDPLSAVDPEVASNIFENCIKGALKDRLVILVTHQL